MHPEWYYEEDGQQQGPITFEQLRQRAAAGLLRPTDLIWGPGLRDWVPASTQSGLFGSGNAPTALPPREYGDRRSADDRPRPAPNAGPLMKIILIGCGGFMLLTVFCCGVLYFIGVNDPESARKSERRWSLKTGENAFWTYQFNRGDEVVLNVSSSEDSDMDLFVFADKRSMDNFLKTPDLEKALPFCLAFDNGIGQDCRVEFTAPETQKYFVLLFNRMSAQADRNIPNSGTIKVKFGPK